MVLVDSSVWIEYFKGNDRVRVLDGLIDANAICINDLILAELLPAIAVKRETVLQDLLESVTRLDMHIDWQRIIRMQVSNLRNGLNGVGLSDLIIACNALDHDVELCSLDRHFTAMGPLHGLQLFHLG